MLQITVADIRPDKSIKKEKKEKNVMSKFVKSYLPLNPLIVDSIIFIIRETKNVKILKTE